MQCLYYLIGEKVAAQYTMDLADAMLAVMDKPTREEAEKLGKEHPILSKWDYMTNAVYVLIDNASKGAK